MLNMTAGAFSEWRKLPVSLSELCINTTLRCGQSFRWHRVPHTDEWRCVLHGHLLSLKQDPSHLYYRTYLSTPTTSPPDPLPLISHYLNLSPNLTTLYETWSAKDPNFRKRAPQFTGIRILRQDAWEALIGFICSSNNNIARIGQMVEKLCLRYGNPIATVDGRAYHDFPGPEALTGDGVEAELRGLGFGYRAKYIWQTAVMVSDKEKGWLDSLRNPEAPVFGHDGDAKEDKDAGKMVEEGRAGYREAHAELLSLQGVGPKVADCVSLMGLGWGEAVPVDTHVWQIAQRDYKFGKGAHKSLTKATYDAVGNHFRKLWGKEAGWAHSVLFTADLKSFSDRLVKKEVKVDVKEEDGEVNIKEEKIKVEEEEEGLKLETKTTVTSSNIGVKRSAAEDIKVEPDESKDVKAVVEQSTRRMSKRLRNR